MEELRYAFVSQIIDTISLQSVPKCWLIVCCSMNPLPKLMPPVLSAKKTYDFLCFSTLGVVHFLIYPSIPNHIHYTVPQRFMIHLPIKYSPSLGLLWHSMFLSLRQIMHDIQFFAYLINSRGSRVIPWNSLSYKLSIKTNNPRTRVSI